MILIRILYKVVFFIVVKLVGFVLYIIRKNARRLIFLGLLFGQVFSLRSWMFLSCHETLRFCDELFVIVLFVLRFLLERRMFDRFSLFPKSNLLGLFALGFLLLIFVELLHLFFGRYFLKLLLNFFWKFSFTFLNF